MSEHDRREEPIRSPDRDDNLPPNPGPMTRLAHLASAFSTLPPSLTAYLEGL